MTTSFTRRAFLARTAATAALAAMAGRRSAARAGMFLSLNSSVAPGIAWPDSARLAARLGYGGIDFPLGEARKMGAEATRALFAELQIQPTLAGLPFTIQAADAAFDAGLADLDAVGPFMRAIGATRMMVVMPTSTPDPIPQFRDMYLKRLTAVAAVLRRYDVRLGLEFLGVLAFRTRPNQNAFIWTLPETVRLAEAAGPNVGAVLDVWHWYHSGGTVRDILATDPARIVHVHLSDARAMPPEEVTDRMRLLPGEGIIDITGFLKALQQINYTGGLAPEPLGRIPQGMAGEEAARLAFDATSGVLRRAGVLP